MNDFAFVAIILVSFVLLALFVTACDRIVGPDEAVGAAESSEEAAGHAVAA